MTLTLLIHISPGIWLELICISNQGLMRILDTGMLSKKEITGQQKPHRYFNHSATSPPSLTLPSVTITPNAMGATKTAFPGSGTFFRYLPPAPGGQHIPLSPKTTSRLPNSGSGLLSLAWDRAAREGDTPPASTRAVFPGVGAGVSPRARSSS